jgi:hypothetical protein
MGSPRLCGCSIFLLLVVVVVQLCAAGLVGPSFATAAAALSTPRRYGPLAEGNMVAEGSTMILGRGRDLLQLATKEDNVPRVTAEARTYVLEEQIHQENATLDLNPNATEKELKTQELELMQKPAEEKKEVSRSEAEGTVANEEEESVLVKKKKMGNETELMASTEEKGLSKAGSEEAVEEEVSASSVKSKVGSKTELTMTANNQTFSKSEAQEEENQEESVSVKRKVGDDTDQQAAAAEETVVSKTHKPVEEGEEEEELVPAKKKTVGKETDDLEEKELTKSAREEGEEGSVPAKKKAFTKSAAEEEAVEEGEEESVPAKKAFTKSTAEEEAVEEGEEESVPAKKKAFTKSAAEEEAVEEGEEESVPAKKKAFTKPAAEEEAVEEGEEELIPAKKKALTKSEAQEEAVEEEEEELSPMKKKVKEAKLKAAAEESPESESEEEEEEEEESLPAKEKVRKEANLKAADQEKESLKSEAQEAVEEEEEEPIPAKKIIGKAATADKKELSTKSDSEEEVEEDEEESIPIKKKKVENSTELNAAAADKKKMSKSEAQEAVEEEEEESIFARKKLGNKTELKAAEKKEMMKSEAEAEEESNSIPVKKKMGIETELQKAAADKKKLSKSEAQVIVEEEDEEQPKDLAAGSKGQKTDVLNKSVKVNGQNGAAKSADAEQQKKEVIDEGEAESQEGMNSQDLEVDLDLNDLDLLQEVQDLPTNIQQTVGAVTTHLLPKIQQFSGQSKTSFDQINKNLASSFLPLIGEKYAPIIATMVSYCLLLLPVAVVLFLCERIRAILTLQKVLLFINIYLAAYFAILFTITLGLRAEPISFFYRNSPSSYIVLQLLQAFGYIIYILLQTADVVFTCSRGTLFGKSSAVIQWLVATLVGLHYYFTVFHRAMARKPLITNWKFYGFYCLSFLVCCLLARIQRSKKEYVPLGDETTDKKN